MSNHSEAISIHFQIALLRNENTILKKDMEEMKAGTDEIRKSLAVLTAQSSNNAVESINMNKAFMEEMKAAIDEIKESLAVLMSQSNSVHLNQSNKAYMEEMKAGIDEIKKSLAVLTAQSSNAVADMNQTINKALLSSSVTQDMATQDGDQAVSAHTPKKVCSIVSEPRRGIRRSNIVEAPAVIGTPLEKNSLNKLRKLLKERVRQVPPQQAS